MIRSQQERLRLVFGCLTTAANSDSDFLEETYRMAEVMGLQPPLEQQEITNLLNCSLRDILQRIGIEIPMGNSPAVKEDPGQSTVNDWLGIVGVHE